MLLRGGGRIEPRDAASLAGLAEGDPDRDAGQPGTERSVATPAGERSIRGHEGLLGGVLGFMQVPEDPMARPDDRRGLSIDEVAEGVTVAGEDGIDDGPVIAALGRLGAGRVAGDGMTPSTGGCIWMERRCSARVHHGGRGAEPSPVGRSGHGSRGIGRRRSVVAAATVVIGRPGSIVSAVVPAVAALAAVVVRRLGTILGAVMAAVRTMIVGRLGTIVPWSSVASGASCPWSSVASGPSFPWSSAASTPWSSVAPGVSSASAGSAVSLPVQPSRPVPRSRPVRRSRPARRSG